MKVFAIQKMLVVVVALCVAQVVSSTRAALVVPDSSTPPFSDWSRTNSNSMYAEWNVFTTATGANTPDVEAFGPTTATVTEAGGSGAFLTGGGNIYSFSLPTDFDVAIPNYGLGAGFNTRVVAQLATLGTAPDPASIKLTYNDGSSHTVAPDFVSLVVVGAGMGASQESLYVWDIAGYNPANMLFEFKASGSSMSLDRVAVDTFTKTGAFGPVSVPEPTSVVLLGIGLVGFLGRRRRS